MNDPVADVSSSVRSCRFFYRVLQTTFFLCSVPPKKYSGFYVYIAVINLCLDDVGSLNWTSRHPLLLSPFLFSSTVYFLLFISLFHCLLHLSVSLSWITALLTCWVQSTQTHFLWCLPAAWLSLAHPRSAMAPLFPVGHRWTARPGWNNHMVPSLFQAFPGSPEQRTALPLPHPPAACPSLALPAWFGRSWEGSGWPGVHEGATLRIFIISFKSSLCSGESSGTTDV